MSGLCWRRSVLFWAVMVCVGAASLSGCQGVSIKPTPLKLAPLTKETWIVVNSAQFEIFSTMSEESTKALARDLEQFHALVYATTNAERRPAPIPTRIYAFSSPGDYRRFGPGGSAGVFIPGLRSNTILISDYSIHQGADNVILHEYVHFVVRNNTASNYPTWYDEGFADFLSTARKHEDMIAIGAIPESRIFALRSVDWVPIRKIISAVGYDSLNDRDSRMLYPESWALVHYLTLDRPAEAGSIGEQLAQYLELTKRGAKTGPAFERAFGESLSEIDRILRRNIRTGKMRVIGIPIAQLDIDESEPSARVATEAEVSIRIGALALNRGQVDKAGGYFRAAMELDPESAKAHAGLGDYHKFSGRFEEAEPLFKKALELAPGDPWIRLDLAEFYADRAEKATSKVGRRSDLKEARRIFREAIQLAPEIPEGHAMLGQTYLLAGEPVEEGIDHLEEAFRILPSSRFVAMNYVAGNVALGERVIATDILRSVFGSLLTDKNSGSIDEQLDQIEKARKEADEKLAKLPDEEPVSELSSDAEMRSGEGP